MFDVGWSKSSIPVMEDFELGAIENFLDRSEPIFKRGKERVAFELTFNQSEIKVGAERQRLRVNLRPAADEDVPLGDHRLRTALHAVPLPIRWGEISPNKLAR